MGEREFKGVLSITPIVNNPFHVRRATDCMNGLFEYVKQTGELPHGFRPVREKPTSGLLAEATHVSNRDWGWLGRNNLLAFVVFQPQDLESFRIVAILPSKTKPWVEQMQVKHSLQNNRLRRTKAAKEKNEVPKFKL